MKRFARAKESNMPKDRLIPDSGRPADLDLNEIKSIEDADRVIWWLTEVVREMERQLVETEDPDPAWLKKVKSAKWWASHIRHKAREIRESYSPSIGARQAVASVILDFLDEDEVEELEDVIAERFPHLTGLILRDVL